MKQNKKQPPQNNNSNEKVLLELLKLSLLEHKNGKTMLQSELREWVKTWKRK